jgi:glycosyltransferase involved in cell wall biosynthesis
MKVAVLTTSYPRSTGDSAGRFVADAVDHVRARGVEVEVVGPQQYRHYGIAYGHGMLGNLRRRPWLAFLVPALLAGFVRAARRVDADLLHAHWLSAGWVAARSGKPYVVQVWGTDVELARRAPWLARRVLRSARLVIAASNDLAERARVLGAREVRVIPSGVELPLEVGKEAVPAEVLYAGRLSSEKGVLELLEAAARSADSWPLRIIGSGPLEETLRTRARRLGLETRVSFRPHARDPERLAARYAAARCVVMPGEHETFGLVALEAAASGAPVAACATAPALHAIGRLGHQFVPGDPEDLDRAIAGARAATPDPEAAAVLAWRHRWDRVFREEAAALQELVA